ncbi:hypothetical protein [Priestia megaterium]|uniref:Uncharacterized protein n=1 Tax=Priestia megaterium TaxID=1404 RepID=A0A6M6E8B6_PRIMG|nr:hypothetical protein [Priestia megaterium]QJX80807.1 hypothetical protein FDZ14_32475 [Priestia megaterium]
MLVKEKEQTKTIIERDEKVGLSKEREDVIKRLKMYSEEPDSKQYLNSFEVELGKKIQRACLDKGLTYEALAKIVEERLSKPAYKHVKMKQVIENFAMNRYYRDAPPNDPMRINMDVLEIIQDALEI